MYSCSLDDLVELWNGSRVKNNEARDLSIESNRNIYARMLQRIKGCINDGSIFKDGWERRVSDSFPPYLNVTPGEVYAMYENSPLWVPVKIQERPTILDAAYSTIPHYCECSPLYCLIILDVIRENEEICAKACKGGDLEGWKKEKAQSLALSYGEKSPDIIFAAMRIDESINNWEIEEEDIEFYENFTLARQMYNAFKMFENGELTTERYNEVVKNQKNGYFSSALEEVQNVDTM